MNGLLHPLVQSCKARVSSVALLGEHLLDRLKLRMVGWKKNVAFACGTVAMYGCSKFAIMSVGSAFAIMKVCSKFALMNSYSEFAIMSVYSEFRSRAYAQRVRYHEYVQGVRYHECLQRIRYHEY